jgi:hypothetical protein
MNGRLLRTLGLGWLAFMLSGAAIALFFPVTATILLIDRSYCAPAQWHQVTSTYDQLYQQHQRQALRIEQVVLFSDLGAETLPELPTPAEIAGTRTYGLPAERTLQDLQRQYPQAQVLSCR